MMTQTKVTIEANIAADKNKVWKYYTDPSHITNWNFANSDWECPAAENDLKVGGKYFARMQAKDGSFGFDFEAVYDAVDEPNSYTYTMSDGRQVTTTFESKDSTTTVTITFDAEMENDIEMQRAGWQAILDNFKHYVEHN